MKAIMVFTLIMWIASASASERQVLAGILEEINYLEQQIAQALKNNFNGEATQGQRTFMYGKLHIDVLRWRNAIHSYLNTPKRVPFDVNAYHDRIGQ